MERKARSEQPNQTPTEASKRYLEKLRETQIVVDSVFFAFASTLTAIHLLRGQYEHAALQGMFTAYFGAHLKESRTLSSSRKQIIKG